MYNSFTEKLVTTGVTRQQFEDLMSRDLRRISGVMDAHQEIGDRLQLRYDKQMQHILSSKQYEERVARDVSRNHKPSYFTIGEDKLYRLTLEHMDMLTLFNKAQEIDLLEIIGVSRTVGYPDLEATWVRVHQSIKKGIHMVPSERRE